jgi:predicted DNA-binding protein YlxM (UPF0122 family)
MSKFKHYSITEFAKEKKVTRQTVYNWIKSKRKGIKLITIADKTVIKVRVK